MLGERGIIAATPTALPTLPRAIARLGFVQAERMGQFLDLAETGRRQCLRTARVLVEGPTPASAG